MAEPTEPRTPRPHNTQPAPPPSSTNSKLHVEANSNGNGSYSGQNIKYPNPPDAINPDAATLRDQWRFAIRQYSKWYSHAWGTAILAGAAFFALGWIVKGSNPIPSWNTDDKKHKEAEKSGSSSSG